MKKLYIFFFSLLFCSIINASGDSTLVISKINFIGNKLTQKDVITRELNFKIGDTVLLSELSKLFKKSTENLMNISLFNFVTITDSISYNSVIININVIERWYIWPIPIFDLADRNFNTWWKTKDFYRVNYGVDLAVYNFRGRNETLDFILSLGYDEKYGIIYKIPYINEKQTLGIIFSANYFQSHEIALKDSNNKVIFFKDNNYPKKNLNISTGLIYRRNIHTTHTIQINYDKYFIQDTVLKLNKEYTLSSVNNQNYFSINYQFKHDFRDYKPYPLHGYYFDIEIMKYGLGLINDRDFDLYSLKSTFRKYFQFSKQLYFASGLTTMVNSLFPYLIQNGLGYVRDYVRGYEYYVVTGQSFILLKNNLKYEIIPQKVAKIKYIKTEKFNTIPYAFFVNLYSDMAYVYKKNDDKNNSLVNDLLVGYGIGIDFVTYYDKVLRLEYSLNKIGESGIFIHFMTSI